MRLMHASIFGFGKWYDRKIDFSSNPFMCIYGENESGKSTLKAFILFMLFGLPPKQRAFYRPKTGAKMGGRLSIFDEKIGMFTIERFDETRNGKAICFTPDGHNFDEDWLQTQLQGMTRKTYESIFSFSSQNLSLLTEMNGEDLSDVLLSVGLTGSKNIQVIEKQLDTQLRELFKPFGKKPAINQQLAQLDNLYERLSVHKKQESTYRQKKDKVHALEVEIEKVKTDLVLEKQRLAGIEKRQQALPLIFQYRNYADQLAAIPLTDSFPEEGLSRLSKIKEKLLPLESELKLLSQNQATYLEQKQILESEIETREVMEQAKQIIEQSRHYFETKKEIERLRDTKKTKELKLQTLLDQLNIGISINDLATISFPFHIEHTWNQLCNDFNQVKLEIEQLDQEMRVATMQREQLIEEKKNIKQQLLSSERVTILTNRIHDYQQQSYIRELKKEEQAQQKQWRKLKAKREKSSNYLLVTSTILGIASGIFASAINNNWLFSAMIIFFVFGFGQWQWQKRSMKEMEQMLSGRQPELAGTNESNEDYEEAQRLLNIHEKRESDLASLEEQLRTVNIQLMQLDERRNIIDQKERRLKQQMKDQCITYPFLEQINITYWVNVYHTLNQALQIYEEIVETCHYLSELTAEQHQFRASLNTFVQDRNWELETEHVTEQLAKVEELIEQNEHHNELIVQYETWINDCLKKADTVKQQMQVYERELTKLLDASGVASEEAFIKKAKQWEERQELKAKLADVYNQLLAIFSQKEWNRVKEEIIDEQKLLKQHEACKQAIETLELDIDAKRQQIADVRADLANMEMSEEYSEILHRFNMEQEQLDMLAREWAVLKMEKELLVETKRKYRDKYLAKVIAKTSAYFSMLTNGAYKQVIAPKNEQLFQVIGKNDITYSVQELSQGTTHQLYIALRLSISEVMSEKHQMPFIIDDAFVHFDTSRTKNMLILLGEIANHQQVVLFTCKKDIVQAFDNAQIVHLAPNENFNAEDFAMQ